MGGSYAMAQAAPEKSDAVPLGCPSLALWRSCILPCRRVSAYAFLHDALAEPQLSTPSQMGDVPVRL